MSRCTQMYSAMCDGKWLTCNKKFTCNKNWQEASSAFRLC